MENFLQWKSCKLCKSDRKIMGWAHGTDSLWRTLYNIRNGSECVSEKDSSKGTDHYFFDGGEKNQRHCCIGFVSGTGERVSKDAA